MRYLILNSAQTENRITPQMMVDIASSIEEANLNFKIKYIVLIGAGKSFSKGFEGLDIPETFANDRLWIQ